MVLLIQSNMMDVSKASEALQITFTRRKTHVLPDVLSFPPKDWDRPFQALAQECHVEIGLENAFLLVQQYMSSLR